MIFRHQVLGIQYLAPYLLNRGVAPGELTRRLNLPSSLLLDDQAWIDRRSSLRLAIEVSHATRDPLAGLHAIEGLHATGFGDWGEGAAGARTLLDLLLFAARSIRRVENGTCVSLSQRNGFACLAVELVGEPDADPRQYLEARLLLLRKLLHQATCDVPVQVYVPHRIEHPEEFQRLLGPDLHDMAAKAALVFASDALMLPANESAASGGAPSVDVPLPHLVAARVMRVLKESIAVERPTAVAVAGALKLNLRSMQRYLAAWGVAFEDMLDQYRQRTALTMLSAGRCSITDVAFRLGYSDSAHFVRAFRRWNGRPPREVHTRNGKVPDHAVPGA